MTEKQKNEQKEPGNDVFFPVDEEPDDYLAMDMLPWLEKAAIFVKPKQPLIDWINSLDPVDPMKPEDFFEGNTYLVDDLDDDISGPEDIDPFVARHYIEIFENELMALWTDSNDWPETISFEMFKEWFEYHVSTMVYNL
ncbi:MAG: hypothetical protein GXO86_13830 [Chlorobi bacterium]|nr:hypothetical protein [Chlorobiota bacterium]